jgi:ornithine carbamoyltransferase
MAYNLKNRSLLSLDELNARDIQHLLEMSHELKRAKAAGTEQPTLRGRNIALIFEKSSTRTRCAFEVAAHDQGAHVSFIGPGDSQLGEKESVKDTARVLGRLYDAIEYRGFAQQTVKDLAAHAGVPVYNGLTNEFHPTQILADLMTMQEHCDKPLREMRVAYLGDARYNMGDSLLQGAALMGMDLRIAAPRALWPAPEIQAQCEALARVSGAKLTLTEAPLQAVEGVDFVYTDVWVSMGEPEAAWAERIALLRPYQVNARLMAAAGHAAVRFMHCLPAYHNRETRRGEEIFQRFGLDGMEVTDEVFESPASIVWDQAENRMHTIKALLVATLG